MRRTSITVQDVASEAGVSKTTAASILRNAPDFNVRSSTRKRVLAVAATLGYQRNALAVALSSGRTHAVGVLLPLHYVQSSSSMGRIYGHDIFMALFRAASRAELRVTPVPLPSSPDQRLCVQNVTDRRVDGLIMASVRDAAFVHSVYAAGIPCVEVGSGHGTRIIHPDNEGGAALAVAHLTGLGHRRIAHWRGQADSYATSHRREGFLAAAARHGLCPKETPVLHTRDAVLAALRLPAGERPTAVFTVNDSQACLTLDIAREAGLRVPEDLSVVGFDDNILAEAARPTLTTIRNPLDKQADAAIGLLQALWSGEEDPAVPPAVLTELIIRASTAPAP